MKIVIDIPEELYKNVIERTKTGYVGSDVWIAVANGTPLPKGHGDLIDRNVVYAEFDKENLSKKEMIGKLLVFGVPTVIPADNSEVD